MTLRDDVRWLRDAADSMLHGGLPTWPRVWSTKEGESLSAMVQELHERWFRLAMQQTTHEAAVACYRDQVEGLRATNERLTDEQLAFGAFFMPEATRTRMKRIHVALARLERITARCVGRQVALDTAVRAECEREMAVLVLAGAHGFAAHVAFTTTRRNHPMWMRLQSGVLDATHRIQERGVAVHGSAAAAQLHDMWHSIGRCDDRRTALRDELVRLVLAALPGGPRP